MSAFRLEPDLATRSAERPLSAMSRRCVSTLRCRAELVHQWDRLDRSGEDRVSLPMTGRRRQAVIVNDRMQRGYQYNSTSRCRLEAENLLLRHQLAIALRRAPPRPRLFGSDRALLIWMTLTALSPSTASLISSQSGALGSGTLHQKHTLTAVAVAGMRPEPPQVFATLRSSVLLA